MGLFRTSSKLGSSSSGTVLEKTDNKREEIALTFPCVFFRAINKEITYFLQLKQKDTKAPM